MFNSLPRHTFPQYLTKPDQRGIIRYMRQDKEKATKLRSLGKSYNEIKATLEIPKSTLSDWFKESGWSAKIKDTLVQKAKEKSSVHIHALNKVRGKHLARLYQNAETEAKIEFETLKFHPLFITGISIYWGEGDKSTSYQVRVANIDPAMIKIFVKFLREVCNVPKQRIRAHLLLYPDLDPALCMDYWIKNSGLSRRNFTKSVVIKGKHKTRRIPYGVCYPTVSSTYLKKKINIWLKLLPRELLRNAYYSRV